MYCFLILVGIGHTLTEQDADVIAKKIANARLFEDDNNKLNFNIQQMNNCQNIISFTIYSLCRCKKGNRPGFSNLNLSSGKNL
ncbi:D-aminoacyl-tRNA deacylase [Staphylococcus aureus]